MGNGEELKKGRTDTVRKTEIRAVYEKDLDKFLESIDLLSALGKGELKCHICGCEINRENLQCVYPQGGEIKVCCSNLSCYRQSIRERERQSWKP